MTAFQSLSTILLFWTLLSMGAAIVGLYRPRSDLWRGFWFMNGMWGAIDGAIVLFGSLGSPPTDESLANILRINLGLDVAYLVVGLVLAIRPKPIPKGFGLAILVQGSFLLLLDAAFYFKVSG